MVNGHVIPEALLSAEVLRLAAGLESEAPYAGGMSPVHLQRLAIRNLVERTLLLQKAAAGRLHVTDAEADAERARRWGSSTNTVCGSDVREAIREDLLVARARAAMVRHVPRPGRAACQEFYERHGALYDLPEAVYAAHVLYNIHSPADEVTAEATLQMAMAQLAEGEAFARVADRYSECKAVGGAVGWVARGEMVAAFEDVVFSLPVRTHSGVFRTVFGLHIAHVSDRRQAGRLPFEKVRVAIGKRLLDEAREAAVVQALARLEQSSDIRVVQD